MVVVVLAAAGAAAEEVVAVLAPAPDPNSSAEGVAACGFEVPVCADPPVVPAPVAAVKPNEAEEGRLLSAPAPAPPNRPPPVPLPVPVNPPDPSRRAAPPPVTLVPASMTEAVLVRAPPPWVVEDTRAAAAEADGRVGAAGFGGVKDAAKAVGRAGMLEAAPAVESVALLILAAAAAPAAPTDGDDETRPLLKG